MRLANVRIGANLVAHVATAGGYVNVADLVGGSAPLDVDAVVAGGAPVIARITDALAAAGDVPAVAAEGADLGPAVARPGKIICLGRNYHEHALEMAGAVPSSPEVFVRFTDSLTGPADDVELPASTARFDYEGELGVVIGAPGRAIPAGQAMRHVAGYVVTNDFSARDWQRAANQWTPGKNFDRSCPVGPEFVSADELGDDFDIRLETRVNGETRQSATTRQLIISVARTIEFLSSFTTLRTGDLILTGTPGGVGDAKKPPMYLADGDLVEVEIERVGVLRNRVVSEKQPIVNTAWAPSAR
jgi:acylpyruvate hydrolase